MKKMITIFTLLAVMAGLTMGCFKKEDPQEPGKPASEVKKQYPAEGKKPVEQSPAERKEPKKPTHGDGQDHSGHNH